MAGKTSVRLMRMARNAILPKSTVAGVVKGDRLGGHRFAPAAVSLHHVSQRVRGADGAVDQLVARRASDCLAQAVEIWARLCRQGRNERQPGRSAVQQERYAHDGRHSDRAGAQSHDVALGAMEYAGPIDVTFSRRADWVGFLRRLCKNYSTERGGNTFPCETLGPGRPGAFHRLLSVAGPLHA